MNRTINNYDSIRRVFAITKVILRLVLLAIEIIKQWHDLSK